MLKQTRRLHVFNTRGLKIVMVVLLVLVTVIALGQLTQRTAAQITYQSFPAPGQKLKNTDPSPAFGWKIDVDGRTIFGEPTPGGGCDLRSSLGHFGHADQCSTVGQLITALEQFAKDNPGAAHIVKGAISILKGGALPPPAVP